MKLQVLKVLIILNQLKLVISKTILTPDIIMNVQQYISYFLNWSSKSLRISLKSLSS